MCCLPSHNQSKSLKDFEIKSNRPNDNNTKTCFSYQLQSDTDSESMDYWVNHCWQSPSAKDYSVSNHQCEIDYADK